MFDYRPLRGKIRMEGKTETEAAKEAGMSPSGLSARLNGAQEFRQSEIWKVCEVLTIKPEEIAKYFFTPKVQETELSRQASQR